MIMFLLKVWQDLLKNCELKVVEKRMTIQRPCICMCLSEMKISFFPIFCLRARLVDYLFPMSKVLKIRVGRSGKKKGKT